MNHEYEALLVELKPWISRLAHRDATVKFQDPSRTEHGVLFSFFVEPEILSLVLRCNAGPVYEKITIEDPVVKRALSNDVPFHVEVKFCVNNFVELNLLNECIASGFLVNPAHPPSLHPSYLTVRARLNALLDKQKPQWTAFFQKRPISIYCWNIDVLPIALDTFTTKLERLHRSQTLHTTHNPDKSGLGASAFDWVAVLLNVPQSQSPVCEIAWRNPPLREVFQEQVVETILSAPNPLSVKFSIGEEDEDFLLAHPERWRARNPHGGLETEATLDQSCGYSWGSPITSSLVVTILKKFRTLRLLSLTNVDLDTMDVFEEAVSSSLEEIKLSGLCLNDRQSVGKFIGNLGRQDLLFTKQLRHLCLLHGLFGRRLVGIQLSLDEVESLAAVLKINRILETVYVRIQTVDDYKTNMSMSSRLCELSGFTVPASLAIRQSPQEKARRLAFLSVVSTLGDESHRNAMHKLDTFLVHQILTFAAPAVRRVVKAWYS